MLDGKKERQVEKEGGDTEEEVHDVVEEEIDAQNITSWNNAELVYNKESSYDKTEVVKEEKEVGNNDVDFGKVVLEEVERLVNDVVEKKVADTVKETGEEKLDETVDEGIESNVKDEEEINLKNRVNKIVRNKLKDMLPSILSGINEVSDPVTGGI